MEIKLIDEVKLIIRKLLRQSCIGGVHTPEKPLFRRIKNLHNKILKKEIVKNWAELVNHGYIWRIMKRTKKGTDYHISVNPKKVYELKEEVKQ